MSNTYDFLMMNLSLTFTVRLVVPSPPIHPCLRARSTQREIATKMSKDEWADYRLRVEIDYEGVDVFSLPDEDVDVKDDFSMVAVLGKRPDCVQVITAFIVYRACLAA